MRAGKLLGGRSLTVPGDEPKGAMLPPCANREGGVLLADGPACAKALKRAEGRGIPETDKQPLGNAHTPSGSHYLCSLRLSCLMSTLQGAMGQACTEGLGSVSKSGVYSVGGWGPLKGCD